MDLWLQNCRFAHIWSCGDHTLWSLDLKFSEMLNTATISFIWLTKVLTCCIKMELWLKNWIFAHIWSCVILTFDLYTLKFHKCKTLPQKVKSFPWIKVATRYIWVQLQPQNWILAHIWSCSDLDLIILSLSYHSLYFHQVAMNSLHAFWSYHVNEIQMDKWTETLIKQPENKMPPAPLTLGEA